MSRARMIAALVALVAIILTASLTIGYFRHHYAVQSLPLVQSETDEPGSHETYIKLAQTEVEQLLQGNCSTVGASNELPAQIKNAFATITRDKPFALADPCKRFNATDVIEPGLPRRRLVLGGHCDDRWFIEYEHGGIGLSTALVVLRMNRDESVTLVWGRALKEKATSADELRNVLNSASFWDEAYSW